MSQEVRINWWERKDYHDLTFAQKCTLICKDGIELFGPGPDGQLCENRHNLRKYVRGRVKWKTEIRDNKTVYLDSVTNSRSSSECVPSTSNSEYLPPATTKISSQPHKPKTRNGIPEFKQSTAQPVTSEQQKAKMIIETAKKNSVLVLSDTVSENITAEMSDFKLPPVMVTKKSPPKEKKKKKVIEKKKPDAIAEHEKFNRSLNDREDPLVALTKKKSSRKKKPIIYKKRMALTMAQEIDDQPQAPNKNITEISSAFETPGSSCDINRAGCSSETFVKNTESQASDKSIDLFQPKEEEFNKKKVMETENNRRSPRKKKKKKMEKTHDDNGLPYFSDNTPEPSQNTVPYQPVVSTEKREEISRPSRQLRRDPSTSSQSSGGPPSPKIQRDRATGKKGQWRSVLVLSDDDEEIKNMSLKRRSRLSFEPRPTQSSSSDDDQAVGKTHVAVEQSIVIEDTPEVQRKEYDSFKDYDYRAVTSTGPVKTPCEKSQQGAFSGESAEDDVFTQEQNHSILTANNVPTTNLTLNTSATLGKRTKTVKRNRTVSGKTKTYNSSDDEIPTTESDIMRRGSAMKRRPKKKDCVTSWLQGDDVKEVSLSPGKTKNSQRSKPNAKKRNASSQKPDTVEEIIDSSPEAIIVKKNPRRGPRRGRQK